MEQTSWRRAKASWTSGQQTRAAAAANTSRECLDRSRSPRHEQVMATKLSLGALGNLLLDVLRTAYASTVRRNIGSEAGKNFSYITLPTTIDMYTYFVLYLDVPNELNS